MKQQGEIAQTIAASPLLRLKAFVMLLIGAAACSNPTASIPPVTGFDAQRYAGEWYEIARLPNRFEDGLVRIKANYRPKDGKLEVVNSGDDAVSGERRQALGRAYFTRSPDIGELRVTFFWPFYGLYKIIELDHRRYSYALVIGKGYDYLWILSRSPNLPEETKKALLDRASGLGFPVERLIYTPQE